MSEVIWVARTAKTLGFSVAPELKEEIEAMAAIGGVSKSALFREMVENYKSMKKEQEFFMLQRKISVRARGAGAFSEEDVEKILAEGK